MTDEGHPIEDGRIKTTPTRKPPNIEDPPTFGLPMDPNPTSSQGQVMPMLLTPGRNQNILHAHKDRALQAGVLTACDLDTRHDPDPPCGTQHGGATYYHLAPGKTWDDYSAAAHPPTDEGA